jgi:hypothetical protein
MDTLLVTTKHRYSTGINQRRIKKHMQSHSVHVREFFEHRNELSV